jgi:hypothetical protein
LVARLALLALFALLLVRLVGLFALTLVALGSLWHLCPRHGRIPGGKNAEYWTSNHGNRDRDELDTERGIRLQQSDR